MTPASPDDGAWGFPNRAIPVGSAAYYAVRFCPPEQRERNALLLAWYELVQEIVEQHTDPGVARLKLDWWRQEVSLLSVRRCRHPLTVALQNTGVGAGSEIPMSAIIEAADDEIRSPQVHDDAAFTANCRRSFGGLFVLLNRLDGLAPEGERSCVECGGYCAAVERIRQLSRSPQRVPPDLGTATLRQSPAEWRTQRLDALLAAFDSTPTRPLPVLAARLLALSKAMHKKIRNSGYPVADTLVERAPIALLWTAWRSQ